MLPVLFQLGPLKLYTYGLMMAIGFIIAISWSQKRAPLYRVNPAFMGSLGFVLVILGIVGARVTYFLTVEKSLTDLFSLKFFEVWNGGMVFYGGFILAVLGAHFYSRKHGENFFSVADVTAPTIMLALFFGRLGCVAAGCCFGQRCELPWAITFTHPLSLAPLHIPLHPTQIYEALFALALCGILLLIQRRQRFNGQLFLSLLSLYAIWRPFVEAFRGDSIRGFITFGGLYQNEWLSTSTFISFGILIVAAALYVFLRKQPTPLLVSSKKAKKQKS